MAATLRSRQKGTFDVVIVSICSYLLLIARAVLLDAVRRMLSQSSSGPRTSSADPPSWKVTLCAK